MRTRYDRIEVFPYIQDRAQPFHSLPPLGPTWSHIPKLAMIITFAALSAPLCRKKFTLLEATSYSLHIGTCYKSTRSTARMVSLSTVMGALVCPLASRQFHNLYRGAQPLCTL